MEIRKIEGIDPENRKAVEEAFAQISPRPIACCNWPDGYPYAPQVRFRMFHTGKLLMLRFDVEENYTAARVDRDNGQVWTDSCVEFFISPGNDSGYYNFETTCIGHMLLGYQHSRADANRARQEIIDRVKRTTSLPYGEPFEEREGDNHWSVMLAIPPQALFCHRIDDWSGLEARINLYKCGDNLSHPHFLSWRPIQTEKPDFHRPEFFERILFEK